jgi:hypothetical protein
LFEALAAFVAWLGASVVVLADGRRGLAVGSGLAAAGIVALVLQTSGTVAAAILAAGAAMATAVGWRRGGDWGLMPAGSTPRIVLCVAGGLLALWVAVSITTGRDPSLRFAVVAVMALVGMRVLSSDDPPVIATSVVTLALIAAAAVGLADSSQGAWLYGAAALVAVAAAFSPPGMERAA